MGNTRLFVNAFVEEFTFISSIFFNRIFTVVLNNMINTKLKDMPFCGSSNGRCYIFVKVRIKPEKVIRYGVAFYRKTCYAKEYLD